MCSDRAVFLDFARSLFVDCFCPGVAGAVAAVALVLVFAGAGPVHAATSANANSPLGMNLVNVNYFTSEQPFLNLFKTSAVSQSNLNGSTGGFFTHSTKTFTWNTNESAYLQVDANGYPTTLTATSADPHSPQQFDSVGVLLMRNLAPSNAGKSLPYPAGLYVVDYDGQGTLAFDLDAKLVSASPGHYVFNVPTPSAAGFAVYITSTDPNRTGNYIHNMRIVKAEQENLLLAGNVFNPTFLGLLQNFRLLRAMQWLEIDDAGGLLVNWSQRPLPTDGGWGGGNGVPLEVVVQLCNAVGADCWVNVPHTASDDYITQMATLAHANLGASQKVYIEYSNEVWNTAYPQHGYAAWQAQAMWPTSSNGWSSWYGMRVAQTCDIWKSAWGADAGRVVCVMGAFVDIPDFATQALNCPLWTGAGNAPCANHGIGAVAIAPYFHIQTANALTASTQSGLSSMFSSMTGGALPTIANMETAYKTALAPYHLPFIAYEAGQTLEGFPTYHDGSAMVNLYIAANRDPRMATVYTNFLNQWKANGGETVVIYADIYAPNQYGEWGALESVLDSVNPLSNAPPKWQAIQNFISANPCWWASCTGSIGASTPAPMAPAVTTH